MALNIVFGAVDFSSDVLVAVVFSSAQAMVDVLIKSVNKKRR